MKEILKIVPLVIYLFISLLSLVMAYKIFFSRKFLPFHEAAYGKPWEEVEKNLQPVILSLLKVSGLGFLIVGFLLLIFSFYNYFRPHLFLKYTIPLIALCFCTGLFIINLNLFKKTKAKTPWKNSLYSMIAIIIGIFISCL